jgi:hypothetical protein
MRGKETGKKLDEVTVDQFGHFYNRHVQPVTFFGYPGDVWVYNHVNVEGELRLRGTGPAVPAEMP